ncbi:preprotein translocase subunit SecE [Schwartzia succinivorans DSM 10502]|uniref:Protein translocase subunit SecE n=1 Tax=Schwartzia succinivorans DSM 10502 TaxID=1123243 RepID=A0A1M4WMT2_9FIRM|nr:preprotein translocase subunit SecE [Schwartzia succinivorans DSM 10502]
MSLADEKASAVQSESGFNPKRFCEEVVAEMKKVSWSSRRELLVNTGVVGVAVVIVCALIWVCDTVFARLFQLLLR